MMVIIIATFYCTFTCKLCAGASEPKRPRDDNHADPWKAFGHDVATKLRKMSAFNAVQTMVR